MKNKDIQMLPLVREFINSNNRNKRTLKNGKKLTIGTKRNYEGLYHLLQQFSESHEFTLRFRLLTNNKRSFEIEKRYHKKLFLKFTDYLFDDLDHYDNYVGQTIKRLRTFYNWVKSEKGHYIGEFHKDFHSWKEDIPILILRPNRLRFLLFNHEFEKTLTPALRRTKDIFVFGCSVALRSSDLLNLQNENIESIDESNYLNVRSQKTGNVTKIKLPEYTKPILKRNKSRGKKLFITTSQRNFNQNIKRLAEKAGWTEDFPKVRTKRGTHIIIYKNPKKREHFRFCDLISTHTMRRTAITNMLDLGVDEQTTRKISGHAPGSLEFYKYVKYNQKKIDKQTDIMFDKLSQNEAILT